MARTRDFLLQIGQENNIPSSKIEEIASKLEEEWYSDTKALKEITESQWKSLGVPARLSNLIQKYLNEAPQFLGKTRQGNLKDLVAHLSGSPQILSNCLLILQQLICNLLSYDDPKYRTVKLSNAKFHEAVGRHPLALEYLKLIGFKSSQTEISLPSTDSTFLESILQELNECAITLGIPPKQPQEKFNPFKATISSTNLLPKPQNYENDPSKISEEINRIHQQRTDALKRLKISRDPKVFRSTGSELFISDEPSNPRLDEEIISRNVQSFLVQRENSMSFQNKRKSELEKLRSKEFIARVVIRVKFNDGIVLEGNFLINESVKEIYQFVEENLERKEKFYLFSIPPKIVLRDMSQSIGDYAPAAVFYFGWNDESRTESYLKNELMRAV